MISEFEIRKDLIGVDEGIDMSVIKLKDNSNGFIGVNKGNSTPVVKLGKGLSFIFMEAINVD